MRTRPITDRDLWLDEWRPRNVNASESGALFGIDKYCSPLELYYRKKGIIGPDEENEAMRRGRWLEPAVLKATAELRPHLEITTPNVYIDYPDLRIGCTPDAFATDKRTGKKGVVQAKTVGEHVFKEWIEEGEKAPLAYQLQTMIESVAAARMDFAVLSLMIVGYRVNMQIEEIPIVEQTWERYLEKTRFFWANLDKGIAPPVRADLDGDLVKKLYPGGGGEPIDLSGSNRLPELLEKWDKYAAHLKTERAVLKPFEKEQDAIKTEIRGMMGDAEAAILPGGKIATLKMQTNKGWTARVLRISEIKK